MAPPFFQHVFTETLYTVLYIQSIKTPATKQAPSKYLLNEQMLIESQMLSSIRFSISQVFLNENVSFLI